MEQYIKNIQEFANTHKLIFEREGECGFGRECVGLLHGDNYVDYNPTDSVSYEPIKEFEDDRLYAIAPPLAYHKHNCLAVLGRGEKSIKQLSDWVDSLKELNVTIETYKTGATGVQAIVSGVFGKTVKTNPPSNTTTNG